MKNNNVYDYLEELEKNSRSRINDADIENTQRTVEAGGEAISNIRNLLQETSKGLKQSQKVMEGVADIAARETGKAYDERSVHALTKRYYGEKRSALQKVLGVFSGKKELTIKNGLDLLEETVEKIPPFVEKLEDMLGERKDEFQELKRDIREKIEYINKERPGLLESMKDLEKKKAELQAEYTALEKQREEDSLKGEYTGEDTLAQITNLDLLIRKCDDGHREIKTRAIRSRKNIELLNAHLRQITEYQDLLGRSDDIVNDAKNYVDIEVPTLKKQIRAQRSEIQSLGGVNEVLSFIQGAKEVSKETNTKINQMTGYLSGRVEDIRHRAIKQAENIYALPPGKKEAKTKEADEIIDAEFEVVEGAK